MKKTASLLMAMLLFALNVRSESTQAGVFDFETRTVRLNSGYTMPIMGLGTYALDHDTCVNSVMTLLESGGRLIDTAYMYGNEEAVGEGVRRGMAEYDIPREDIFVITKIYPSQFGDPEAAVDMALQKLDIGYIDMMLSITAGTPMTIICFSFANLPTFWMGSSIGLHASLLPNCSAVLLAADPVVIQRQCIAFGIAESVHDRQLPRQSASIGILWLHEDLLLKQQVGFHLALLRPGEELLNPIAGGLPVNATAFSFFVEQVAFPGHLVPERLAAFKNQLPILDRIGFKNQPVLIEGEDIALFRRIDFKKGIHRSPPPVHRDTTGSAYRRK